MLQLVQAQKPYYRGVASTKQVVCVTVDILNLNRDMYSESEMLNPDFWLDSVGDGESCWVAAKCQLCKAEYRPVDGTHVEGVCSYCPRCAGYEEVSCAIG